MELTELINRGRAGDAGADAAAVAQLYVQLKGLAAQALRRLGGRSTLDTTAVVHEAYEKLAAYASGPLADRRHYLRLAARAMRQVVVDHARAAGADKRGADAAHLSLGAVQEGTLDPAQRWLDLEAALRRLELAEQRVARVVEAHVFGGMTFDEIAAALGISERTARSDWKAGRAWLACELGTAQGEPNAT
jgi:RNA polymerase sigma factor (TIGR02999 family)